MAFCSRLGYLGAWPCSVLMYLFFGILSYVCLLKCSDGLQPNSKRNPIALASNLIAMASNLIATASNLISMASNPIAKGT